MKDVEKAVRGSGRIAFLARLEEIKKKEKAGYPLLTLYREYQQELSFSYSQFVKYVHKYIRGNNDNSTGSNKGTDKGREDASRKKPQVRTRSPDEPAFVSSDEPRSKDELIGPKKSIGKE